ncbi:hypothetical protein K439DRAFT_1614885 [Ramaria rubella]|nr:hypothetical protein K439DRAFT_1614885 [Ramaria rubella]
MHFFILFTLITSAFAIPLLDKETNVDVKLPIDGTVSVTHYGRYNPHGDAALREAKYILGTREVPFETRTRTGTQPFAKLNTSVFCFLMLLDTSHVLLTRFWVPVKSNPHGDAALREAKYVGLLLLDILGTREVPLDLAFKTRTRTGTQPFAKLNTSVFCFLMLLDTSHLLLPRSWVPVKSNPHGDAALREAKYVGLLLLDILGTREVPLDLAFKTRTRTGTQPFAKLNTSILGTREVPFNPRTRTGTQPFAKLNTSWVLEKSSQSMLSHTPATNWVVVMSNGNALAAAKFVGFRFLMLLDLAHLLPPRNWAVLKSVSEVRLSPLGERSTERREDSIADQV